jgi:hypothetical protein
MGAMKEHACAFEAVASKQKQIYNDACDSGYPYNTNNVPKDIQLLIDKVKDLKGSSLIKNREVWENQLEVELRVFLLLFKLAGN